MPRRTASDLRSRRRLSGASALALLALACLATPAGAARAPSSRAASTGATPSAGARATGGQEASTAAPQPVTPPAAAAPSKPPSFAVGVRILRLVDTSRTIRLPGGRTEARPLETYVRYPAPGPPRGGDLLDAPAAAGPFPLVVFGHGFAVTPRLYGHLLDSWVRAGYVVAAPVFPLANANAPGGPDESDLVNQPTDMSFVISSLIAASSTPGGALTGLIDPSRIAVAGQSDGGVTALATAFSRRYRDPRVDAAVVMAGSEMSGVGGYGFHRGEPALLAIQGTADTINEPRFTYQFFKAARQPKFLLRLLGAEHLPPYTREEPQLSLVERVTIAFLDGYLKKMRGSLHRLVGLGDVPRRAAFAADP